MPTSVPMMPDAGALQSTDWLYLIQGMNLDRDKKVSLATVREYCTANNTRVIEALVSDAVSNVLTVDIAGTTNVLVLVRGNSVLHDLHLTGNIPVGCTVMVGMQTPSDSTPSSVETEFTRITMVNGTSIGAFSKLKVYGVAIIHQAEASLWYGTVVNDEVYTSAMITKAVANEASRAVGAEADLESMIGAEIGRAQGAESGISGALSGEIARATAAEEALRTAGSVYEVRKFPIRFIAMLNPVGAGGPDHVVIPTQNNTPVPASATEALVYNDGQVQSHGIVQSPKLQVWHETANDKWLYPSDPSAVLTGSECGMKTLATAAPGYNGGTGTDKVNVVTWSPNLGDIIVSSGRSDGDGFMHLGLLLPPRPVESLPVGTVEEFFFRVKTEGQSVISSASNFALEISVMDPTLYGDHGWQVELDSTCMGALRSAISIRARRRYTNDSPSSTPELKVDYWPETFI